MLLLLVGWLLVLLVVVGCGVGCEFVVVCLFSCWCGCLEVVGCGVAVVVGSGGCG